MATDDKEIELMNELRLRQGLPPLSRSGKQYHSTSLSTPGHLAIKLAERNELMRLLLARNNASACAKILGKNRTTILKWIRSEGFMDELRALSKESWQDVDDQLKAANVTLGDRLEELQSKALDTLESLMDSSSEAMKFKAADSVLDRSEGTAKNSKSDVKQTFKLEANVLMHAARTALELEG